MEPIIGFEPTTPSLRIRRNAFEYFLLGEIATNVCIDIAQFENTQNKINKFLDSEYKSVYQTNSNTHIEMVIKEQVDKYEYPTKRMNDLVIMLDSRRVKSFEIYTISFSTVIGGIIGGVIGILFGK